MEGPSHLSGAMTNWFGENFDCNGRLHQFPVKNPTHNDESSTSKFRGVMNGLNGQWGAQIYKNHQHVWLGTLKSEMEAAMVYESAMIKLHNGSWHRNFPWTELTYCEQNFQDQFNIETILSMIKDGSYAAKFSDFLRAQAQLVHHPKELHDNLGIKMQQLFQKELTPSDVGKLNRLVIPKKDALKYFPVIPGLGERNQGRVKDLDLIIFYRSMKPWEFRYCFWGSSQSFVFTKGWKGFVKEKGLTAKDRVIFNSYQHGNQERCMIDVEYHKDVNGGREDAMVRMDTGEHNAQENGAANVPTLTNAQRKRIKLFGIEIISNNVV